jgi:hypothetical protein
LDSSGEIIFFFKINYCTKIWTNHGKLAKWVVKWTLAMTRLLLKKSEPFLSPAKIAK